MQQNDSLADGYRNSMAADAAHRIAALLAGEDAQREEAYFELDALADGGGGMVDDADVRTAAACVPALVDSVLCADAGRIGGVEVGRATVLLSRLLLLDPLTVHVPPCHRGRA